MQSSDPVKIFRDRLIASKQISVQEYNAMDKQILAEIENRIIKFAEESPEPSVDEVTKYVFAENDPFVLGPFNLNKSVES